MKKLFFKLFNVVVLCSLFNFVLNATTSKPKEKSKQFRPLDALTTLTGGKINYTERLLKLCKSYVNLNQIDTLWQTKKEIEQEKKALIAKRIRDIQDCLDHGATLNTVDENQDTTLHTTCKINPYKQLLEFFFKNGATECFTLKNKQGMTPLALILSSNNTARYRHNNEFPKEKLYDLTTLFLQNGAKKALMITDNDGATPLLHACSSGINSLEPDFETIKELLVNGAEKTINTANNNGITPLFCITSCSDINTEILKLLLKHGASASINTAIKENKNNSFMSKKADDTAFLVACRRGCDEAVQLFLEYKATEDINTQDSDGNTPLLLACAQQNIKLVKMLLDNGAEASVNTPNNKNDFPLTKLFYPDRATRLHRGYIAEILTLLFKHGAAKNINTQNDNKETILFQACNDITPDIIKILLEHGAKTTINTPNKNGSTPLLAACAAKKSKYDNEKAHLEMIKLLIEAGADLDIKNKSGVSARIYINQKLPLIQGYIQGIEENKKSQKEDQEYQKPKIPKIKSLPNLRKPLTIDDL